MCLYIHKHISLRNHLLEGFLKFPVRDDLHICAVTAYVQKQSEFASILKNIRRFRLLIFLVRCDCVTESPP